MKKIILAGASTFAILAFAGSANALDVTVDIGTNLDALYDDPDFAGLYINAAVNAAEVNGSVNIEADPLIGDLNASSVTFKGQGSGSAAVAATEFAIGGAAGAGQQIDLSVVGNRISSTQEIATTAIGAVNDGTISLAARESSAAASGGFSFTDRGGLIFDEAASNATGSTENTSSSAAARATSLLVDNGFSTSANAAFEVAESGPAQALAANLALNLEDVNGSVNLSGATINDIAGTATTAIGAVNTGIITNGLPGSIDIVAGKQTTTTNTNTTTGE